MEKLLEVYSLDTICFVYLFIGSILSIFFGLVVTLINCLFERALYYRKKRKEEV